MIKKIKKIINNWDPISLFPGAPEDEYEKETKSIDLFIKKEKKLTKELLQKEIYAIFKNSFGEKIFKLKEKDCNSVSEEIMEANKSSDQEWN